MYALSQCLWLAYDSYKQVPIRIARERIRGGHIGTTTCPGASLLSVRPAIAKMLEACSPAKLTLRCSESFYQSLMLVRSTCHDASAEGVVHLCQAALKWRVLDQISEMSNPGKLPQHARREAEHEHCVEAKGPLAPWMMPFTQ